MHPALARSVLVPAKRTLAVARSSGSAREVKNTKGRANGTVVTRDHDTHNAEAPAAIGGAAGTPYVAQAARAAALEMRRVGQESAARARARHQQPPPAAASLGTPRGPSRVVRVRCVPAGCKRTREQHLSGLRAEHLEILHDGEAMGAW